MNSRNIILLTSIYLLTAHQISFFKVAAMRIKPLYRTVRNADGKCKVYDLRMLNCGAQISRNGNERFRFKYEKTCNIKQVSFTFKFGKEGGYSASVDDSKPIITFSQMKKTIKSMKKIKVFHAGTHYISADMKARSLKNVALRNSSEKCNFYIKHERATARLGGNLNRNVDAGERFYVDAGKSINNDFERKNYKLEYRWECNSTGDFCKTQKLGNRHSLMVPPKYVIEGHSFNFTVHVRSPPTDWASAVQLITVNSSSPFTINCVIKCGKYPNTFSPNLNPALLVDCHFNCSFVKKLPLFATFHDYNGEYLKTWSPITKLLAANTELVPGKNYTVKIFHNQTTEDRLVVEQTFFVLNVPKLSNCKSIPPKGTPFTKFKVKCDYNEKERKHFVVLVKKKDAVLSSTKSPKLEDVEVSVSSPNSTINVRLENFDNVYNEQIIPVQIESLIKPNEDPKAAVDRLADIYDGKNKTESVEEMIKQGKYKAALHLMDVVAQEMANIDRKNEKAKKTVNTMKKKLLADLVKIPVENIDISKSVSGLMRTITDDANDKVSDSDMAKLYGETCSELAKQQLNLVENDIAGEISENDNTLIRDNLMSCSESEMDPYYEMFNETAVDIKLTTPFPLNANLTEESFEDYPQYVADDLIEDKVKDFIAAAESMIEICRDMVSSLIYAQEKDMDAPKYVKRKSSIIAVMKSTGVKVAESIFRRSGVTITPSQYLHQFDTTVSMRVCIFKKDPFWSVSQTNKIPTNVIDVTVRDESEEIDIKKFYSNPIQISFKVFENVVHKKVSQGKVEIFDEYSDFKEDEFTIFMIKSRSEESFFVDFQNIEKNDSFEIIIMEMERPRLEHFSSPLYLNEDNKKFFISHLDDEDKWFMLGMRPDVRNEVSKESLLNFSVYTPMCKKWDSEKQKWEFACSVYITTTFNRINCRCSHLSTLAGVFEYNEIKMHPKFIKLDYELEEVGSLYIIVAICILMALYFYFLMYAIQKNETLEDAVCLMSDVPAENRFAYLVVVKTGGRAGSGTSSDIVIRLFGKKNISQEHVINFPDPLMEYLQRRQEDYFVLASPVHLGKLEKIDVWFDCTGASPTWYCQYIRICDLQTKAWYFFKINKWFEVDREPKVFLSVPATTDRERLRQRKKSSRLLQSFLSFGRFDKTMWQISTRTTDRHFEYPKRLTVILSLILTINTLALELMGRPDFTPRDAITRRCYFQMSRHYLNIGIYSAMLAFFPHLGIMEGFKHSRIQFEPASRQSNPLSPAFTVFFWTLLIFNIILQLHILLIYGYRVIAPETWEWLVAATFGSLFYVFILDYVYNMFIILVGGPLKPVKLNFEKIIRIIEGQRKVLYKLIGRYIYRPILGPVYVIMSKADYARIRVHFRQKREMVWQVNDFFMIISFILLLYAIVLGEKDANYDFRGHTQALNLVEGSRTRKIKLDDIDNVMDIEAYFKTNLIPIIQSYVWYGKYVSESPGMTTDSCNKYMGVIRIRQQRTEEGSCRVVREMRFLNVTCRTPSYFFRNDFLNYTPAWNNTIPEAYSSRLGYVWGYQEGVGKVVVGLTGYYESGGYVANLGRTIKNSYVNFNYLKRYKWLDPLTRGIIVEFCLYNVNKNLFHFVEILWERGASGFINRGVTVQTERVVKHTSRSQQIALFCSFFFMILIVALSIRTVIRIIKTRVWYKRDLWHIIDVLLVVLSLLWIIYHFRRLKDLAAFVKNIEENPNNTFVNYFAIINIANWMRTLAAFLICLSTLRMWRILRFGVIFRTVERTILLSVQSLCIMLLYIVIILVMFGVVMHSALGSQIGDFRNVYFVSKTLLLVALGFKKPSPDSLSVNERGLGYTTYIVFSLVSKFLITVFVAIIIVEYIKARQFAFEEILDYNLKDYAIERYAMLKRKAIILSRKFRLTAGGKRNANIETVIPKDDSLRYKNCVQIDSNKMEAMATVAKCVLLKIQKGLRVDETDHALMWRTIRNLQNEEESSKEFFFIESLKDFGFVMVDNRKLLLIEEIVRRMLHISDGNANEEDTIDDDTTILLKNKARMKTIYYRLNLMKSIIENIEIKA